MLINEGESPISDVSKGSRGMKEIINLAFRLTAMQYLNLQDSALYLDEAGAAFDLEHRKTFLYALKGMIEQKTFSQIFLVSHDFMQYGAMTQSEYCVLNNTNVMVPEKYNQHVKMS
jgi:ABC-type hemin transport system ATPase subunit